jgi:hypothetical protein
MFGTSMHEGHAQLGIAPLAPDGKSWSAKIPANVPVHLQPVDKFGMSIFSETVWFSGRPGEQRVCGGCHEDRTRVTNVPPGVLDTFAVGAADMFSTVARTARLNKTPSKVTDFVGMGWDTQVQPAFAACLECHDHNNAAGLVGYTITDAKTGMKVADWTFNLEPGPVPAALSVAAGGGAYSQSYFSMLGPDREAIEKAGLVISGNFKVYMKPLDARGSIAVQKLNPYEIFPTQTANRAFPGMGHMVEQGRPDIAPLDVYRVVLASDMGGQYFARENKPAVP